MKKPQDSTIRNVQAANRKFVRLFRSKSKQDAEIKDLKRRVKQLEKLVGKLK